MLPDIKNMPEISRRPALREVATALVEWIGKDEFVLRKSVRGKIIDVRGAPRSAGWDFRLRQFAYAMSSPVPAGDRIRKDILPITKGFAAITAKYDWRKVGSEKDIAKKDLEALEDLARQTVIWGGLRPNSYDFSNTWKVVKTAITNRDDCGAPMNSGWTKVAALATYGRKNEQNIYDSRCSFSILHRLDLMGLAEENLEGAGLDRLCLVCSGRGGTRKKGGAGLREFKIRNPNKNTSATWGAHFACAELVREMADVLNSSGKYPKMPAGNGKTKKWDVFGVGIVLFMDGY